MPQYYLRTPQGHWIPLVGERIELGRTPADPDKRESIYDFEQGPCKLEGEHLYVPLMFVSRKHAALTRGDDGSYSIEDVGSRSGTYVNGAQIKERTVLQQGDRITIATLTLEVWDEESRLPAPPDFFGSD